MPINVGDADYTPQLAGYTGQGQFRFWCQKVLPIVYDDSLSYYELLGKVVVYLNNVISDVSNVEDNVGDLNTAYTALQGHVNDDLESVETFVNGLETYMDNYFTNLDVQEEIDNKLDEMAGDGSLTALISPLVASGAPDIITDWMEENITPTTPIVDASLTVSGAAADAKVTGDEIADLKSDLNTTKAWVGIKSFSVSAGFIGGDGNINNPSSQINEKYTSAIPVTEGESLEIDFAVVTATNSMWLAYATYDENDTFIERVGLVNSVVQGSYTGTLSIPDGVGSIRFTYRSYDGAKLNIYTDDIEFLEPIHAKLVDIQNTVYEANVTASYERTLSVGSSILSTTHIFDVAIPRWQYYSLEVIVTGPTRYELYENGTLKVGNLAPNTVFYGQATQDISYISVQAGDITGGSITCKLKLFSYNKESAVSVLKNKLDYVGSGDILIPYLALTGFYYANGTLSFTEAHEVHTDIIPTADVSGATLNLQYGDPTDSVWFTYVTYDASKNITGRTEINATSTGGYSGVFTPTGNPSYVSFQFRTYDDYEFTITKKLEIVSELETEIERAALSSSTVRTVAHRGDDIEGPQCTAPAYILARKHGNTVAENDLWLSEDGQLVMWHDITLERLGNLVDINGYLMYTNGTDYYWVNPDNNSVYTWNGSDYVSSAVSLGSLTRCAGGNYGVNSEYATTGLNLATLKRIDFGIYKGSQFAGTQIMTFAEWVLLCKQLGMEIYIDSKLTYTDALLTEAANTVKRLGMGDKASWLGVSLSKIATLRSIIPDSRCGILSHPTEAAVESCAQYNTGRGFFFDGNANSGMTAEAIRLGLDAGFDVEVYYVDVSNVSEADQFNVIRTAISYGVTAMTLDHYRVDEAFTYLLEQY